MTVQLPPAQQQTLHQFITAFLPPRGNKRKSTRNELSRVHLTLHRVLQKHFGFGVTPTQALDAFQALGYAIFTRKGAWHPDKKEWLPAATGDTTRAGLPYEEYDAGFLYVDVEAPTVAQLWLVTISPLADTNPEKLLQQENLLERICAFKQQFPQT